MTNELIVFNEHENEESFLMKLNQATGQQALPVLPMLKFDAEVGIWKKSTDQKDAENKTVYEDIGEAIEFQIITTRKMVQSAFSAKEKLYSREFQDSYLELYDESNKVVAKGLYNALKLANPDLKFVQVLYVYFNDQPYRIKLSGSKLSGLFDYMKLFKTSNPAMVMTRAERGEKIKSGAIDYYELRFAKGEEIVDRKKIIERVNGINQFMNAYANVVKNKAVETIDEQLPPPEYSEPDDINVADIKY